MTEQIKELREILLNAKYFIEIMGEACGVDIIIADKADKIIIVDYDASKQEAKLYGTVEMKVSGKEYTILINAIANLLDEMIEIYEKLDWFLGPEITIYKRKEK